MPKDSDYVPKVKSMGSVLIVDGKRYGAKDLESLKGQKVDWAAPVIAELEDKLRIEEYRLIKLYGQERRRNVEFLKESEVSLAAKGVDPSTTVEESDFADWLNSGSPGIKKYYFYHVFGADRINRITVAGFLKWVAEQLGLEKVEVRDLDDVFGLL